MFNFPVDTNLIPYIIAGIGLLTILYTYFAVIFGKVTGKLLTGFPFVGGIIVIIGFLLSGHKILALTGLLDCGPWYIMYYSYSEKKKKSRLWALIAEKGYLPTEKEKDTRVVVYLPRVAEEYPYYTNGNYYPEGTNISFAVCRDSSDTYLILDRGKKSAYEIIPFEKGEVLLKNIRYKRKMTDVKVRIKKRLPPII